MLVDSQMVCLWPAGILTWNMYGCSSCHFILDTIFIKCVHDPRSLWLNHILCTKKRLLFMKLFQLREEVQSLVGFKINLIDWPDLVENVTQATGYPPGGYVV